MDTNKNIKIMLSGGGTGGSVTSLLAIADKATLEKKNWEFVFIGTNKGPEKDMLKDSLAKIRFRSMVSGKLRRYFSLQNLIDLFKIFGALFQSFLILHEEKPDLILSAGSFVSVPLIWAAGFKKIPVIIHQQDVRAGLANRLMAPAADIITVTFANSLADYGPKAIWIGNPTKFLETEEYKKIIPQIWEKYGLHSGKPLVLVTGGRMGAGPLNKLFEGAQLKLSGCQIVHLTGSYISDGVISRNPDYHILKSLPHNDFLTLMVSADLVVSRAGLGSLTELSELNKATIIIPLPNSHQEDNAEIFSRSEAALVLNQKELTPDKLASEINFLLSDEKRLADLRNKIFQIIRKGAALKMLDLIEKLLEAKRKK